VASFTFSIFAVGHSVTIDILGVSGNGMGINVRISFRRQLLACRCCPHKKRLVNLGVSRNGRVPAQYNLGCDPDLSRLFHAQPRVMKYLPYYQVLLPARQLPGQPSGLQRRRRSGGNCSTSCDPDRHGDTGAASPSSCGANLYRQQIMVFLGLSAGSGTA